MLQFIRSQAGSFIVKLLFVLLILSFGVWGIGDFLRQRTVEATVIEVGSTKIPAERLNAELQRTLRQARQSYGPSLDLPQARLLGITDRVVQRVVGEAVADEEASHLGLSVGDAEIAAAIGEIPNFRGPGGVFDRSAFLNALSSNGLTEKSFIQLMRGDLVREAVAGVAVASPPKALAEELYKLHNEQRAADVVFLPTAAVQGIADPDPAALKDYYDKHHAAFTAPEYRGFTALILNGAAVASEVKIGPDQVKAAYQDRQTEFTKVEKRHVLQIIAADEATAKAASDALAAGQGFDQVATAIAKQDASTIDLGLVAKTDLPAEIADAAFAAAQDQPTAPVKSLLGWHILKVTAIEPGGIRPFEEVSGQIEAELRKDAESDALYKLSQKVEDAIAAGVDLGSIATQFNLTPFTVATIDLDGKDANGVTVEGFPIPSETLLRTVFDTGEGQISGLQEAPAVQSFYVVRTDRITAPALKPFEAVGDQVKAAWLSDARIARVEADAKAMAAKVTGDQTLARLAGAAKLGVTQTRPFTRSSPPTETRLPPALVAQLFSLPVGGVATAAGADGQFVAQLKEIRPADPAKDEAGLKRAIDGIQQDLNGELQQELVAGLRLRHPVEIHQAELDRVTGGRDQP